MQPRGIINFNNKQTSPLINPNSEKKKELFKEVFAVDQSKIRDEDKIEQPKTADQKITEAEEEAQKDIIKDSIKDEEKSSQKLDDLIDIAQLVLYRTKSTNPIDLFPDEIIVDMNKVSIIHNQFFLSSRIHSVMIKDVSDVFVDTGFFWAKLSIVDTGFVENEVSIEFLKKEDALKIRRIIQGLVVTQQQQIDFTKLQQELSQEEIIDKIEKLGKARIGVNNDQNPTA